MKKMIIFAMVGLFFFSAEVFPQLRKENKSVYLLVGADMVPTVEGNGAMSEGGVKPFIGAGLSFKIDAVTIDGNISYIVADGKLFTVGAGIYFETTLKDGPVRRPLIIGPKYKLYVSEWEIHSINLHISYQLMKSILVYVESGFATFSLREGRETEITGQMGVKVALNWK